MFEKNKQVYCESCFRKNEKDYALIIGHIRDNPGATIMEIINATGATLQSINCFIEDGSVSYVENKLTTEGVFDLPSDKDLGFKAGKFHGSMRGRR